jgi:pimeloyl-ACP methyl ester carboxylesterase
MMSKEWPKTSHWPQLDRPEEINGIIDEFLAAAF